MAFSGIASAEVWLLGYHVHRLRGRLRRHHAVAVSADWRVTFRSDDGDVVYVGYVDYHWEVLPWR